MSKMKFLLSVLLIGYSFSAVFAEDKCYPDIGYKCNLCEPKGDNVKVTFKNLTGWVIGLSMPVRYYNWENKYIDTESLIAGSGKEVCARKNTTIWGALRATGAESSGPAVEGADVTCWLNGPTAKYICNYSAP